MIFAARIVVAWGVSEPGGDKSREGFRDYGNVLVVE